MDGDEQTPLARLDTIVRRQEAQRNQFYSDVLARDMTLQDAIFEVERELRYRAASYTKSIAYGEMSVAVAKERFTSLRVALRFLEDLQVFIYKNGGSYSLPFYPGEHRDAQEIP
jgi:hypothetical protein